MRNSSLHICICKSGSSAIHCIYQSIRVGICNLTLIVFSNESRRAVFTIYLSCNRTVGYGTSMNFSSETSIIIIGSILFSILAESDCHIIVTNGRITKFRIKIIICFIIWCISFPVGCILILIGIDGWITINVAIIKRPTICITYKSIFPNLSIHYIAFGYGTVICICESIPIRNNVTQIDIICYGTVKIICS